MSEFVKRVSHIALRVPDLEASVAWATTVMGLRESERHDDTSYLTHAENHHSLQYIQSDRSALDHIAMEAHDVESLERLLARVREHGLEIVSEEVEEQGIAHAFRLRAPEGHVIEVFAGMDCSEPAYTGRGVQPGSSGTRCSRARTPTPHVT